MLVENFFSENYQDARRLFREMADAVGAEILPPQPVQADPAQAEEPLTIEVAVIGPEDAAETIVLSCALHGVEGIFGAAAQLAVMADAELLKALGGRRLVLVFALNPFGFAHHRRCNENGVDLNRNFLQAGELDAQTGRPLGRAAPLEEQYDGCSDMYRVLNPVLNPKTAPRRLDSFYAVAAAHLLRHGRTALAEALVTGQYEYADGLWWGGKEPQQLMLLLQEPMRDEDGSFVREAGADRRTAPLIDVWCGESEKLTWFDLHTGLGKWGTYRLFVNSGVSPDRLTDLRRRHGDKTVVATFGAADAPANRGVLRNWVAKRYASRDVAVMTAEFGTYGPVTVLMALRAEQRAWLYADRRRGAEWTAQQLREVFAPTSRAWRRTVVTGVKTIVRQALS